MGLLGYIGLISNATSTGVNQSINKSIFCSANIPGEARLNGARAELVIISKIDEAVL